MIDHLTVGFMQENTYLIMREQGVIVIDPGAECTKIKAAIAQTQKPLTAILLTHAHFDHIGAVDELYEAYHCPIYASCEAINMSQNSYTNLSDQFTPFTLSSPIKALPDELKLLDLSIQVINTPGHTDGDVCFYVPQEKALFTGDTLFQGSAGRTDFPTGNLSTLMHSLKVLKELPFDATVYPGHMGTTTLDQERQTNAYFAQL